MENYQLESRLGSRRLESQLQQRQLSSNLKSHYINSQLTKRDDFFHLSDGEGAESVPIPRIRTLLKTLPNLQTAFICHEIFKKPPGL